MSVSWEEQAIIRILQNHHEIKYHRKYNISFSIFHSFRDAEKTNNLSSCSMLEPHKYNWQKSFIALMC